jgi:DNA repair exonuclease SbcCD ATPase subunit
MDAKHIGVGLETRRFRGLGVLGLALVCFVGLAACNRNSHFSPEPGAALTISHVQQRAESAPGTLSREHTVTVEVAESELNSSFKRLSDRCTADSANHCTILQSDVSSGQYSSGLIKLRIDPKAVEDLIGFAAGLGRLEHRATQVEDLAEAIQDTQSRIEMLTTYRKQLLELQAKAGSNIDAAIKVASELSTVQGNLEQATGQVAYQTKRTTTDIVTIHFLVSEQKAFWRPIREAVRNFFGNLSEGISQAITAVAYILPWLLVVIPGLYLVRFLWRRRGR